jgi:uncharacterized iron-regulated membrane protein
MRTIRASEIGTYLYCQRAWWYQRRGEKSSNQAEMASGTELHYRHGRAVILAGCLNALAIGILMAGLVLLVIYFTNQFL